MTVGDLQQAVSELLEKYNLQYLREAMQLDAPDINLTKEIGPKQIAVQMIMTCKLINDMANLEESGALVASDPVVRCLEDYLVTIDRIIDTETAEELAKEDIRISVV